MSGKRKKRKRTRRQLARIFPQNVWLWSFAQYEEWQWSAA